MKFISRDSLKNIDNLFDKWGNLIIIANRFMSGTRAVISFFAGMSKMPLTKTMILSGVSALIWNMILISLGMVLGNNWRMASDYLSLYGQFVFPVLILVIVILAVRWLIKWRREKKVERQTSD